MGDGLHRRYGIAGGKRQRQRLIQLLVLGFGPLPATRLQWRIQSAAALRRLRYSDHGLPR
jgi:hypothetical protein